MAASEFRVAASDRQLRSNERLAGGNGMALDGGRGSLPRPGVPVKNRARLGGEPALDRIDGRPRRPFAHARG